MLKPHCFPAIQRMEQCN